MTPRMPRQLFTLLHADVAHAQDIVCSGNKTSGTLHAHGKCRNTESRLAELPGWAPYEVPDVRVTWTIQ